MRLIKVERENLALAWKDALPYLQNALKETPECNIDDVYHLLNSGVFTLLMFYNEDDKRCQGAMVTEVIEHPRMTVLVVFLMGADDFTIVEGIFDQLVEFGRRLKVKEIECFGRFGLEKLLKKLGFSKSYIALRYELN